MFLHYVINYIYIQKCQGQRGNELFFDLGCKIFSEEVTKYRIRWNKKKINWRTGSGRTENPQC